MPLRFLIPMAVQIVGLIVIAGVAIAAWGLLGFLGWLGVVLYLVGEETTPEPPEEPPTAEMRGR